MSVEIFIKKVFLDGGLIRFDIMGKSLPENFLGLAADLNFSLPTLSLDKAVQSGQIKYERMEWGNAFTGFSEDNLPIKMIKNSLETGKIIVGISLTSNNLKLVKDGVIGSLFFSQKEALNLQFEGFEHQVLSKYEGGRVDVKEVKWLSGGEKKMPQEILEVGSGQINKINDKLPVAKIAENKDQEVLSVKGAGFSGKLVQNKTDQGQIPGATDLHSDLPLAINDYTNLDDAVETDLNQSTLASLLNTDLPLSNQNQDFLWWISGFVIGFSLLVWLSFKYLKGKSRKNISLYK